MKRLGPFIVMTLIVLFTAKVVEEHTLQGTNIKNDLFKSQSGLKIKYSKNDREVN